MVQHTFNSLILAVSALIIDNNEFYYIKKIFI